MIIKKGDYFGEKKKKNKKRKKRKKSGSGRTK